MRKCILKQFTLATHSIASILVLNRKPSIAPWACHWNAITGTLGQSDQKESSFLEVESQALSQIARKIELHRVDIALSPPTCVHIAKEIVEPSKVMQLCVHLQTASAASLQKIPDSSRNTVQLICLHRGGIITVWSFCTSSGATLASENLDVMLTSISPLSQVRPATNHWLNANVHRTYT